MSMNSEKTLYKKNTEPVLTKELFQNPTSEYRGTPFWAWNCKITKELIDSQLDCFEKMGFGGAHLHARTGLETDYLGEEFLNLVRYTDEEMKKRNMLCWLYDEDRFPSYQGTQGKYVCFPGRISKRSSQWKKACRLLCVCLSCVDSGRISEIL